jgi:hypothetical protein
MKKFLFLIGITGVLGLVNVATRADAAKPTTASVAPPPGCDPDICETDCTTEEHCYRGVCLELPPGFELQCVCLNQDGTRCF